MASDLSRSLVDAAAEAANAVILAKCPTNVMPTLPPGCTANDLGEAVSAAVLETLAAHYYDRAAKRAEAAGEPVQCDGDCGNGDCHTTSAVAAWQMAAAVAQRIVADLREG